MKAIPTMAMFAGVLASVLAASTAQAQIPPKMKMTTDIPAGIAIPDKVETRLGTLKFFDGFPDDATVEKTLRQPGLPARCAGVPAGPRASQSIGQSQGNR